MQLKQIAHIESLYGTKFGVPRQAGIVQVPARVVFEPDYRVAEALRGIEEFDYIWLLWHFDKAERDEWSPTVRPPRLGGNKRMGVFATRSPFRPNAIGLSSVRLVSVEQSALVGPVLNVLGADLMNGTPIFDIKPYLPYTDCHSDANGGFAQLPNDAPLQVVVAPECRGMLPDELLAPLVETLRQDPRPQYHNDAQRVYAMDFAGYDIRFTVDANVAKVVDVVRKK